VGIDPYDWTTVVVMVAVEVAVDAPEVPATEGARLNEPVPVLGGEALSEDVTTIW